jgi:hypothetical protein
MERSRGLAREANCALFFDLIGPGSAPGTHQAGLAARSIFPMRVSALGGIPE